MRRSLVEQTRVVVTGGRGFVGSALLALAQRAGYRVASYDLRDGLDICDPSALHAAIEPGDTVVHLAAYADLYVAREHPVDCVRVNVLGTTLVAEATRQRGARLILGSTLCVYGNQPHYPTPEDARPNPSEIYAQTKLAAEQVVRGMVDSLGLQAAIVRFPGVYGPGMRDSLAVARFMHAASEGGELLVHGDGAQTRTPMHVEDVADGLLAVVQHERVNRVINLAAPEEISALDLARRVVRLAGRGTIRHTAQRSPQTLREFADGTLAAQELSWKPQRALDEGLAATWEWWQSRQPPTGR
jgi:nucleoside-diphosphate-sugar epimerase